MDKWLEDFLTSAQARARMLQNKAAERAVMGDPVAAAGCAAAAGELVSIIEGLRQIADAHGVRCRDGSNE
jgi:hypothetical protein